MAAPPACALRDAVPRPGAGETHVVVIQDMKFSPAVIRLRPGDRVAFENRDIVVHTATSRDAGVFDSGPIKPGGSWTLSPPAGRVLRFFCRFHPTMEGEIAPGS